MKCKFCKSTNLVKRGNRSGKYTLRTQFLCKDCGKFQSSPPRHKRSARILLLDIETLPMEVRVWNPKQEYIRAEQMIKDWSVSCWAAKWLFEPEIMGEVVKPQEAIERREGSILNGMWKLMNEADIIVTQNGIDFDIKKLNTKFLIHGYNPPSHFLNVDTLKVARGVFGFSYNSLNELGRVLGIGQKIEMKQSNWNKCADGDKQSLLDMLTYCKNDVAPLLEDVYLKMLPWMASHPNMGIFAEHDKNVCPKCESTDLSWNTTYKTPQGLWEGFRCNTCGATGRGTKNGHKIKSAQVK